MAEAELFVAEALVAAAEALVVVAVAAPEAAGDVVAPASGAVDWPAIWASTSGVNLPVIPAMLKKNVSDMITLQIIDMAYVNLAEKARAGNCGALGSLAPRDSIRMKLEYVRVGMMALKTAS